MQIKNMAIKYKIFGVKKVTDAPPLNIKPIKIKTPALLKAITFKNKQIAKNIPAIIWN